MDAGAERTAALPDFDEFVASARTWLASLAAPRAEQLWGAGSDAVPVFESWTADEERAETERIRRYEQARFDSGWGPLTWDAKYGGASLPASYAMAFRRVEEEFDVPRRTEMFSVTQQLVAPTILAWGTPEQRERWVRSMLRADVIACQLFSETEAGSDLAAVRTRAERDGDSWRLVGHKVWTSGARIADVGIALCRTNSAVAKHSGLTMFLVPMSSQGVEVRPIRQMTGGSSFCEVYLDNVVLGDEYRLGPLDQGWRVALTVLASERLDSGLLGLDNATRAIEMARHHDVALDSHQQDRVADLAVRAYVQRLTGVRVAAALVSGQTPGAEASVGKLLATDTMARTSEVVRLLLGSELVVDSGRWGTFAWTHHVLGAPGYRIAGGTDEVQRNILAQRVLGLPRSGR